MTEFEICLNLIGFLVFTILLCIKMDSGTSLANLVDDENTSLTWFKVFLPLFFIDILQANFCTIVFMRQLNENIRRDALLHFIISCLFLVSRIAFKILLFLFITKTIDLNAKLLKTWPPANQRYANFLANIPMNQIVTAFKFSYVVAPLFLHLNLFLFRSCSLKKYQVFHWQK